MRGAVKVWYVYNALRGISKNRSKDVIHWPIVSTDTYGPTRTMERIAANGRFEPILLKNTCLIVGTATDSILSTTGRIGDDGTETGSAGGFVLRVLA